MAAVREHPFEYYGSFLTNHLFLCHDIVQVTPGMKDGGLLKLHREQHDEIGQPGLTSL